MIFTEEGRKRLLRLMLIQEMSQRQLAKAIGWESHSYLGRFIRGEVRSIDTDTAHRIALVLGVDASDLFVAKASTGARQTGARRATRQAAA